MSAKISVIVPCYNQDKFLAEALNSIIAQTYTNWECIIVNDGSTDNTETVAQNYIEQDNRFIYIKKDNGGLSSARNAGLKVVSGKWIQFLDADDYIEPTKFEDSFNIIATDIQLNIVISNFKMFVANLSDATPAFCELKQEFLTFENIVFGWDWVFTIPIHCGMFDASLFKEVSFNETLKAKEDWVMWIEIFKKHPKAYYLNKTLSYYRNNPESLTKDHSFVLNYSVKAYKHILNSLPEIYAKRFACAIIDNLYDTIIYDKNDLLILKNNRWVKIDRKIKNGFHKVLLKLKRN